MEITTHRLIDQASGFRGIKQTLSIMRRLINDYKVAAPVRELSLSLVRHLPQKDFRAEIRALWYFVKNRIRYTLDVNGVETLQSPLKTLEYGAGDCDDKVILLGALLESIGHPVRLHAMGFKRDNISHVVLDCKIGNKWITLETTEPVDVGWRPHNIRLHMYG